MHIWLKNGRKKATILDSINCTLNEKVGLFSQMMVAPRLSTSHKQTVVVSLANGRLLVADNSIMSILAEIN